MARIFLSNGRISNCKIGIAAGDGAEVHVDNVDIDRAKIAVLAGTLPKELIDAMVEARDGGSDEATFRQKFEDQLKEYGVDLGALLAHGANIATVVGLFLGLK